MAYIKSTAASKSTAHVAPIFACCAAVALASCGGGGGGGGTTSTVTVTPTSAPATSPITSSKGLFVYIPSTTASLNSFGMPTSTGSNVTLVEGSTGSVTASGNLTSGQSSASTGTIPRTISVPGVGNLYEDGPNDNVVTAYTKAGSSTLADSKYGIALMSSTGFDGLMGGYYTGNPTTQVPTSGTASYSGTYTGMAISGYSGGILSASEQTGNVNLTANFGSGAVNGTVTGLTSSSSPIAAGYGIMMNGTINGNSYTGTANIANSGATAAAGTTTSSALNGSFFGTGAAETAGALAIRGTSPTGTSTIISGAFGAKK